VFYVVWKIWREKKEERPVSCETGRRENCDEELFVFFLLFLAVALLADLAVFAGVLTALLLANFADGLGPGAAGLVFQRKRGSTQHSQRTGDDGE